MYQTLITEVTMRTSHASKIVLHDALTLVAPVDTFTVIAINGTSQGVTLKLTGAERIALIEALGGKAHD